jgi:hypothetical protein
MSYIFHAAPYIQTSVSGRLFCCDGTPSVRKSMFVIIFLHKFISAQEIRAIRMEFISFRTDPKHLSRNTERNLNYKSIWLSQLSS